MSINLGLQSKPHETPETASRSWKNSVAKSNGKTVFDARKSATSIETTEMSPRIPSKEQTPRISSPQKSSSKIRGLPETQSSAENPINIDSSSEMLMSTGREVAIRPKTGECKGD